jgi:hypothetical protein
MDIPEQLALAVDAYCGQARITRAEFFRQTIEQYLQIAPQHIIDDNKPIIDPTNPLL